MNARGFTLFDTPVGTCGLAWGEYGITGASLPGASAEATRAHLRRRNPALRETAPSADMLAAIDRITRLLRGEPDDLLDLALDMRAIPAFDRSVYEIARRIRPGNTRTYGDIAIELGDPYAARSVGQALGANPFPIVVPCHRVMASGGKAGGFSAPGGTRTKLRLLEIEGAPLGGTPGLFDPPARETPRID
jgi:methylated-DNA-[protein]-cysteine S-methyltransferase